MPETNRYYARLASGLCGICGQDPHEPGRTKCASCATQARKDSERRRALARRRGLCDACLKRKVQVLRFKSGTRKATRCAKCATRYLPAQLKRDRMRRRKAA